MPTTLEKSREFLARGVARIRSGLEELERRQRQPGPEISVEPFGPGSVTTAAGLVKLGTSIGAARRRRANFEFERQGTQLEREKIRADIARLRAQEKYYLGEGRQPTAAASQNIVPSGPHKGKTFQQAALDVQNERLGITRTATEERTRRVGRVSAARAKIADLDRRVEQRADVLARRSVAQFEPLFQQAADGDTEAMRTVGIDPDEYESGLPSERLRMFNEARAGLLERAKARQRASLIRITQDERARAQQVLDQGMEGFEETGEDEIVDYVLDEEGNFVPAGP